jgi:hypothetical protein
VSLVILQTSKLWHGRNRPELPLLPSAGRVFGCKPAYELTDLRDVLHHHLRTSLLLIVYWTGIRLLTTRRCRVRYARGGRGRTLPRLNTLSLIYNFAGVTVLRQRRSRNHGCHGYEQQFHFPSISFRSLGAKMLFCSKQQRLASLELPLVIATRGYDEVASI